MLKDACVFCVFFWYTVYLWNWKQKHLHKNIFGRWCSFWVSAKCSKDGLLILGRVSWTSVIMGRGIFSKMFLFKWSSDVQFLVGWYLLKMTRKIRQIWRWFLVPNGDKSDKKRHNLLEENVFEMASRDHRVEVFLPKTFPPDCGPTYPQLLIGLDNLRMFFHPALRTVRSLPIIQHK